jgi:hypothetical protein
LQGWQAEQQHAAALQQDLQFFKAASAAAISERDKAAFEASSTRADLEAATNSLQDTQVGVEGGGGDEGECVEQGGGPWVWGRGVAAGVIDGG